MARPSGSAATLRKPHPPPRPPRGRSVPTTSSADGTTKRSAPSAHTSASRSCLGAGSQAACEMAEPPGTSSSLSSRWERSDHSARRPPAPAPTACEPLPSTVTEHSGTDACEGGSLYVAVSPRSAERQTTTA